VAIIEAQDVSKQFLLRHNPSGELKVRFLGLLHPSHRQSVEEFWALRQVSLSIDRGEAVGLVGRNGSGKSTLLKLIAAIHRPTTGRLLVARGARISSMIELGVGFHPELTGRENVFLNAAIHGLTRPETEAIYAAIVDYSGLAHFIDVPIKNYSSGMYMRLGFSIAANLNPDILLLDEIFAVGDADFQQRCIGTLERFMEQGRTIIFVSHSPGAVRAICRRTCVLEQGELAFDGDVEGGLAFYHALLARRTEQPNAGQGSAPFSPQAVRDDLEPAGASGNAGHWSFEFLRREGLQPHHHVLRIVPGPADAGRWPPFLAEHHCSTVQGCAALFRLGNAEHPFDFAVAESVLPIVPFNVVARCIASVVRKLQPSGRFYATWFENPDPADFEPLVQANGMTSYPDREPYHYPYALIANLCEAIGATVDRVPNARHPTGESVLVIARKPSTP
jgi:ABC-type polysaccharide/polyol phosphate transport system ATPase subunit